MFQSDLFQNAETVDISSADHTLKEISYIWVGGGGASSTLKVTTKSGVDVTFTGVLGGYLVPVAVSKVFKTGTNATNMVALS